jgi:hypothetical protein
VTLALFSRAAPAPAHGRLDRWFQDAPQISLWRSDTTRIPVDEAKVLDVVSRAR